MGATRRTEDGVPGGGRGQVETAPEEVGQLPRPLVQQVVEVGVQRGRQCPVDARQDAFVQRERVEGERRIDAQEPEDPAEQLGGLLGDRFVEADEHLLAREDLEPAPELAEVVAAGEGPLVPERLAPERIGHAFEVVLAVGEPRLAVAEVVPGVRPGAGDRVAHEEDQLHVGQ